MAQQIIQNGDTGLAARQKINANFTDLYGNKIGSDGGVVNMTADLKLVRATAAPGKYSLSLADTGLKFQYLADDNSIDNFISIDENGINIDGDLAGAVTIKGRYGLSLVGNGNQRIDITDSDINISSNGCSLSTINDNFLLTSKNASGIELQARTPANAIITKVKVKDTAFSVEVKDQVTPTTLGEFFVTSTGVELKSTTAAAITYLGLLTDKIDISSNNPGFQGVRYATTVTLTPQSLVPKSYVDSLIGPTPTFSNGLTEVPLSPGTAVKWGGDLSDATTFIGVPNGKNLRFEFGDIQSGQFRKHALILQGSGNMQANFAGAGGETATTYLVSNSGVGGFTNMVNKTNENFYMKSGPNFFTLYLWNDADLGTRLDIQQNKFAITGNHATDGLALILTGLPTSAPSTPGQVWNNAGVLTIV